MKLSPSSFTAVKLANGLLFLGAILRHPDRFSVVHSLPNPTTQVLRFHPPGD